MKVIYVAGPFRAKTPWLIEQNVRRAEELALKVWQSGHAAICPHAITRFYQESAPDDVWTKGDLEIMKRCDAVLLVSGWQDSIGTLEEIRVCKELGIPVFEDFDKCVEFCNTKLNIVYNEKAVYPWEKKKN